MKVYTLTRKQLLPITLSEAWGFFSTPENLAKITPKYMGFHILYTSGNKKMYAGQIIKYRVNVLPGVLVSWTTEITHVDEPNRFVDEQKFGPYALWHHQHPFRELSKGVEMIDEVNYAIPFGFLGRFVHWLFVGKQVNSIFNYRCNVLENCFKNHSLKV